MRYYLQICVCRFSTWGVLFVRSTTLKIAVYHAILSCNFYQMENQGLKTIQSPVGLEFSVTRGIGEFSVTGGTGVLSHSWDWSLSHWRDWSFESLVGLVSFQSLEGLEFWVTRGIGVWVTGGTGVLSHSWDWSFQSLEGLEFWVTGGILVYTKFYKKKCGRKMDQIAETLIWVPEFST
jgi:hypothetical protein